MSKSIPFVCWLVFTLFGGTLRGQTNRPTDKSQPISINFDSLRGAANQSRGVILAKQGTIYGNLTPDSSRYHALIISVQRYNDPAWPTLEWPGRDGDTLKQVLTGRYTFTNTDVRVLKNPTRAELYAVLQKYQRTLTPRDNLLIFYAGHGYYDRDTDEGFWILKDGERDNRANWFSNQELRTFIRVINTQHTLVIADACFAGTLTRSALNVPAPKTNGADWETPLPDRALQKINGYRSRQVMTSGAIEPVLDRSVFLESLVRTLTVSTLRYLVAFQLFSRAQLGVQFNSEQRPLFTDMKGCGGEPGGDFVFTLKK